MRNKSKSLLLSIFCTRLFLVLLTVAILFAHRIPIWYFGDYPGARQIYFPFQITIYLCAIPGYMLLFCLDRLLRNIRRGEVFQKDNIKMLCLISWCCIAVGVISLGASFYYASFAMVAVACAFFGLIIRVIKNVFEQAAAMKEEADYTI